MKIFTIGMTCRKIYQLVLMLFILIIIMNFRIYQTINQFNNAQILHCTNKKSDQIRIQRQINQKSLIKNKTGHWNQKQNAKYYAFVEKFKEKFCEKESRRQWKVFKALSQFIKSRNANQCRSHHHKMQKNFKTIQQTLNYLKTKRPGLDSKCQKYSEQLKKIESKIFIEGNNQIQLQNQHERRNEIHDGYANNLCQPQQQYQYSSGLFPGMLKQSDIRFMKTADCYDQIQPQMNCNFSSFSQLPVGENYQTLAQEFGPEKGFQNPCMQTKNNFQFCEQVGYNNFGNCGYFKNYNPQYYQKLMECHQSFLKWFQKMSCLMAMQEQEKKFAEENQPYYNFGYNFY